MRNHGLIPAKGKRFISLPKLQYRLSAHPAFCMMGNGESFSGGKATRALWTILTPPSAKVKNVYSCTCTFPYAFIVFTKATGPSPVPDMCNASIRGRQLFLPSLISTK